MKMPDPIIEPATSIVESSNPSPRMNFVSVSATSCVITGHLLAQRFVRHKHGKQLRVFVRRQRCYSVRSDESNLRTRNFPLRRRNLSLASYELDRAGSL